MFANHSVDRGSTIQLIPVRVIRKTRKGYLMAPC